MIQETKDIRKEIFKQPMRKGRPEDTGTRGTRGRGKETDSRQAGRELGGGGAGAMLGQTPEERAEGKGEGRAGGGAQGPQCSHSFREGTKKAREKCTEHRPQSPTTVNQARPASCPGPDPGLGALPSTAPSPNNKQSAPKTTRSFHATYRGPEQGSGDGGFGRQWTRALGWGPPGWGELSSQDWGERGRNRKCGYCSWVVFFRGFGPKEVKQHKSNISSQLWTVRLGVEGYGVEGPLQGNSQESSIAASAT